VLEEIALLIWPRLSVTTGNLGHFLSSVGIGERICCGV
jgi:hypothetical protein